MYYVRTGDRLRAHGDVDRALDGGVDHVRDVVLDDALGLGAELEADMAAPRRHLRVRVEGHRSTTPSGWRRFVSFVNAPDEPDPTVVFVRERGQIRPARPDETAAAELAGAVA